jgi:predicted phosphate transport protein (TIGR00153 family)
LKFSIFPKNYRFYDLFEQVAAQLVKASETMTDMLDHFENVDMKTARLKEIEHDSDNLTHDIYTLVNQTFVTPLDREDIAALAQTMDDVVDYIEAAGTAIKIFGISAPTPASRGLADLARLQCLQLQKAIPMLRVKSQLKGILDLAKEINRLENEADTLYLSAMADLFTGEMSTTDIIKWRDVYEYLEESTDSCENVAHVLESIVLKHG